jgi:hypothetical protein
MNLAPLLIAALAVSAPAQEFAMPAELGAVVLRSRTLGAGAPAATAAFRAAVLFQAAPAGTPINTGFQALGVAGKTGTVKGPPFGGGGTYNVIRNDPAPIPARSHGCSTASAWTTLTAAAAPEAARWSSR